MLIETPFSIPIPTLTQLGPADAVEFFRNLLWDEAFRTGVSGHLIDVPDCINVGDGGLDAYIEQAKPSDIGVIPRGTSGFQVKSSGKWSEGACQKELHVGGKLANLLKPEIAKLLGRNGTYVLVLFLEVTPRTHKAFRDAIVQDLRRVGYGKPKVRVYTANQLQSFARVFPALVLCASRRSGESFFCHNTWAGHFSMRVPMIYVSDEARDLHMSAVRKGLRQPDGTCPVFRISGLPGIGKTRFTLETLCLDDLKNRVVYVEDAQTLLNSGLYRELQDNDNLSAVLVVDNCDLGQHRQLVNAFAGRGQRLALVTLSYEKGEVPRPTKVVDLNPLERDRIAEIIAGHASGLPSDVVSRLAQFADGYPRIAVLLADSYVRESPTSESLISVKDDELMNRLISSAPVYLKEFTDTEKVLTGLSLFGKVGFKDDVEAESIWVANEICKVPSGDFKRIVADQKSRGVVQGEYYVYVTPFMLRVYLLRKWWQVHGLTRETFDGLVAGMPGALRADMTTRLFEHIPYIAGTDAGTEFVKAILSKDGMFADGSLLESELGSTFFRKLAEADPGAALACLQQTIGMWPKDRLLLFTTGRREIVWALEGIAIWRDYFQGAARLLLALGEAENETFSNNASGVFAELFSPGPGAVAPTEAQPQERLPILEEALDSNSKERRLLALRAADQALETNSFTRMVGAEYQGLSRLPDRWSPKTYGELWDAYRRVWELVRTRLDKLPPDEQQKAAGVLFDNVRGILRISSLGNTAVDTLAQLANNPHVGVKSVLQQVIRILRHGSQEFPSGIVDRLCKLEEDLTGNDFHSLLRRYVGMSLMEDGLDEHGKRVDRSGPHISSLASQAVANPDILGPDLGWLVTEEARNGYRFGYELAKADPCFQLLDRLVDAQRNAKENGSAYFLGGYFHYLAEVDASRWEVLMDRLAVDAGMRVWIPELTWRSGLTDRAALRVLDLATEGAIETGQFRVFGYGGELEKLSEEVFMKWIDFLLGTSKSEDGAIALDFYHSYYRRLRPSISLPARRTIEMLVKPVFVNPPAGSRFDTMANYHWVELAKAIFETNAELALQLADRILAHLDSDDAIFKRYDSEVDELLNSLAESHPNEMWGLIGRYLVVPPDGRTADILIWLREGAWELIPRNAIWRWVDEDVDNRAWLVAYFSPKGFSSWETSFPREILVRYGDREDVRNNLQASFSSGVWWGRASQHFEGIKDQLLAFLRSETNRNVKAFLNEYVSYLESTIRSARMREEREGD